MTWELLMPVFGKMLRPRQRNEIRRTVVERLPVAVVDDPSPRKRPVSFFPHDDGARSPRVRFSDFDPSPRGLPAVGANARRADGQLVVGALASDELGCRRKMQSAQILVPRDVPPGKGVRRRKTDTELVPQHPRVRHGREAGSRVPRPPASLRAETCAFRSVGPDHEGGPADLAVLRDHRGVSIAGTTGMAQS